MPDKHKTKLDRIGSAFGQSLGTLGPTTSLAGPSRTPTQNFAAALYQGSLTGRGMTRGEVINCYVADGDLIQAEVESCIEGGPLHGRDTLLEATRREVQLVAVVGFDPVSVNTPNRLAPFRENIGYKFWWYNPMSAALTTGGTGTGSLWTYGRWKD